MKKIYVLFNAFVFTGALLFGLTAVAAFRFVLAAAANAWETPVISEKVVPIENSSTSPTFDQFEMIDDQPASNDLDPSGTYVFVAENIPKAFADIESLDITTREYTVENGTYTNRPIVPSGMLETTEIFEFSKIYIGGREISFETEPVNGVSYQLVGTFLDSSEMITCETCEYPRDLKGHLKKIKNGKVIAEMNAEFFIAGC
jgi:hypothetical protein